MPEPELRIIKRYRNRKLYDMVLSSYITLPAIADMIKKGYEVKVIDHETGQDITSVVLAQIILETERSGFRFISLGIVKRLFELFSSPDNIMRLRDDLERGLQLLIKKGEGDDRAKTLRELFLISRANLDAIKANLDERVSELISKFLSALGLGELDWVFNQLKETRRKLEELENKVKVLEGRLNERKRGRKREGK